MPHGVLDFSTGVSPFPPPVAVLEAMRSADVTRYPHPTAAPLRNAIAEAYGLGSEEVVAGAGSVELIWALCRAFVGAGREALVFAPAFGEYAQAARASGGRVVELRAEPPSFSMNLAAALAHLRTEPKPSLAFLCRPSNPCLSSVPLEGLDELVRAAPATLFVVDEAYLPMFADVPPVAVRPNVAVLRSLAKVFALPGLRLGYLLADPAIARAVRAALPPWNVSSPAAAAGIAAMAELHHIAAVRDELRRLREALALRLASPHTSLVASGGPFLLYDVGDSTRFSERLALRACRVRDCGSFGLRSCVRVGVRLAADQDVLARAWHEALDDGMKGRPGEALARHPGRETR